MKELDELRRIANELVVIIEAINPTQKAIKPAQSKEVKHKTQKIDMESLVGSNVICEFWDDDVNDAIKGLLIGIDEDGWYEIEDGLFRNCRPAFSFPQAHLGGDCPIPDGFEVEFFWSSKDAWFSGEALNEFYYRCPWDDAIIYRVVGIKDGWEL